MYINRQTILQEEYQNHGTITEHFGALKRLICMTFWYNHRLWQRLVNVNDLSWGKRRNKMETKKKVILFKSGSLNKNITNNIHICWYVNIKKININMNNLLGNKFTLLTLFLNESFVLLGFFLQECQVSRILWIYPQWHHYSQEKRFDLTKVMDITHVYGL